MWIYNEKIVNKLLDRCKEKRVGFLTFRIMKNDKITNRKVFNELKKDIERIGCEILICTEWDREREKQHYHCIIIGVEKDIEQILIKWNKENEMYSITYRYEEIKKDEIYIKINYTIKQAMYYKSFDVYFSEKDIAKEINRIRRKGYKETVENIGGEITKERWLYLCMLEDIFKEFYFNTTDKDKIIEGEERIRDSKEFSKYKFWNWVVETPMFKMILNKIEKEISIKEITVNEKEYNKKVLQLFEEFLHSIDIKIWIIDLKKHFKNNKIKWVEELTNKLRLEGSENEVEFILKIILILLNREHKIIKITKKEIMEEIKKSKWIKIKEERIEIISNHILKYLIDRQFLVYTTHPEDKASTSYYKLAKENKWSELFHGFKNRKLMKLKTGVTLTKPKDVTFDTINGNFYNYGYILNEELEILRLFKDKVDNKCRLLIEDEKDKQDLVKFILQFNALQRQGWVLDDLGVQFMEHMKPYLYTDSQKKWFDWFEWSFDYISNKVNFIEGIYEKHVDAENKRNWSKIYKTRFNMNAELKMTFQENGYDMKKFEMFDNNEGNFDFINADFSLKQLKKDYKKQDISFITFCIYKRTKSEFKKLLKSYSKYLELDTFFNFIERYRNKEFYYVYYIDFRGRRYVNGFLTAMNNIWLRQIIKPFNKQNIIKHELKEKLLLDLEIGELYLSLKEIFDEAQTPNKQSIKIKDLFEFFKIDDKFILDFENKKDFIRNLLIILKIYWSKGEDVDISYLIFRDAVSSGSQIMSFFIMDVGMNEYFKLFFDINKENYHIEKPDTYKYIIKKFEGWVDNEEGCKYYLIKNKLIQVEEFNKIKFNLKEFMNKMNSINFKHLRSIIKKSVMTLFYNVGLKSMREYMYDGFKELNLQYDEQLNSQLKNFINMFCIYLMQDDIRSIIQKKTNEIFNILKFYNKKSLDLRLEKKFINVIYNYNYFNNDREYKYIKNQRRRLYKDLLTGEISSFFIDNILLNEIYLLELITEKLFLKLLYNKNIFNKFLKLLIKNKLEKFDIKTIKDIKLFLLENKYLYEKKDYKSILISILMKNTEFLLKKKRMFILELINNEKLLEQILTKFKLKKYFVKKDYSYFKDKTSFMPNLIHSIDASLARLVIYSFYHANFNNQSFDKQIFVIHDSFGTQYNYIHYVKQFFNQSTIALVNNSNYYDFILNSISLKEFREDFEIVQVYRAFKLLEQQRIYELEEGSARNSIHIQMLINRALVKMNFTLENVLEKYSQIEQNPQKLDLIKAFIQNKKHYDDGKKEQKEFLLSFNYEKLVSNLYLTTIE